MGAYRSPPRPSLLRSPVASHEFAMFAVTPTQYRTAQGEPLPVQLLPSPQYTLEELQLEVAGLRLVNAAQRAELATLRAELATLRAERA
jgi:hypothetical protein